MKVICARCGEEMQADVREGYVVVEPCKNCEERAWRNAIADGREAGYFQGLDAANRD